MKYKKPLTAEQTVKWIVEQRRKSGRSMWGFYILLHPVALVAIAVTTGGLSSEMLMTVVFVSVVTLLMLLYSRSKMNKSWTGTVTRKEIVKRSVNRGDDQPNRIVEQPQLRIQTTKGKKLKEKCLPAFYEYVREGDTLVKLSGFSGWEKAEVDGITRACIYCGTVHAVVEGRCPRCKKPILDHATLVKLAGG